MTCTLNWLIPEDDAELQLRLRPLREHWEARGPGMLGRVGDLLPWLDIPSQVTVRLINPQVGGAGRVLDSGEIEFEAVLANPLPFLPEVVRLSWLIATSVIPTQANGTQPTADSWRTTVSLIPAVLEAAEFVDLARCDEVTVNCALENWGDFSELTMAANLLSIWHSLNLPVNQQAWLAASCRL